MAEKLLFPRLNNLNYNTWKTRMEMLLKREEMWSTVSGNPPAAGATAAQKEAWNKADEKALATIVLFVEDGQLNLVKDAKSSSDAWNQLKNYHEKKTMTSRVSLLRRICSLNMAEGANMEKHLLDLEDLFDRLSCAGQALESPLKVAMVYRSLPESYSGLITAMESRPDADHTMELVKQKLLDEHQRRVERFDESGEKAMRIQGKKQHSEQREKGCFYCGKPGHFRRNCQLLQQRRESDGEASGSAGGRKQDGTKAKKAAEVDNPMCFVAGGIRRKGCWYVDSGCSCHMTNDKTFFNKIDETVKVEVVLADGSTTKSVGIGEGYATCLDAGGKAHEVLFKEVLYVPSLDSGLLSVRKLTQKGLTVRFEASKCEIIDPKGKVAAVAERRDNLYVLRLAEQAKLSSDVKHCENADAENDHQGKPFKVSFPKATQGRATRILDLVHVDVCGPAANVTPGGCRYLMTLVDEFSGYTVVCLLRQKSDAARCIKRYVAHVKHRFGRAPGVIRADRGCANQELRELYELEGIRAQFTTANSQKKGVAEHKNRTLLEMAAHMLLDAGLPKKYWGEAVMTATYIQNRLPSFSVDTTPFEKWFGCKPSLKHLRVFGSVAYVPDAKLAKFKGNAQKLVLVGYCDDRKSYRFLDPATDRITISRDARFVELTNESLTLEENEELLIDAVPKKKISSIQEESSDGDKQQIKKSPIGQPTGKSPDSQQDSIQEEQISSDEEEFYGWDENGEEIRDGVQRPKRSTRGVLPQRLKDFKVDIAKVVLLNPDSYEQAISCRAHSLMQADVPTTCQTVRQKQF